MPLIVLWAGYETTAKVIILFLFAFFPMVINTYQGVKSVDPKLLEVGRAFRCSERQLWANIVLPGALPFIVTGIRLAVGRGMIGMVLADLYTAISGIGYLIVRIGEHVPGRQDVRADRDAGPARRHADRAAAVGRAARGAVDLRRSGFHDVALTPLPVLWAAAADPRHGYHRLPVHADFPMSHQRRLRR